MDNFDLFMFEDVASTPVQLYNLSALAFPENIPYDISFFAGSNTPPVEPPPGDAGIEFDYKFYKYNDFTNGGEALDQLAVLGDSVLEDARYVLDVNASSLLEGYNIESTDFTIKVQHELFELIDADDIQLGFDMPIANAVKIDEQTGNLAQPYAMTCVSSYVEEVEEDCTQACNVHEEEAGITPGECDDPDALMNNLSWEDPSQNPGQMAADDIIKVCMLKDKCKLMCNVGDAVRLLRDEISITLCIKSFITSTCIRYTRNSPN